MLRGGRVRSQNLTNGCISKKRGQSENRIKMSDIKVLKPKNAMNGLNLNDSQITSTKNTNIEESSSYSIESKKNRFISEKSSNVPPHYDRKLYQTFNDRLLQTNSNITHNNIKNFYINANYQKACLSSDSSSKKDKKTLLNTSVESKRSNINTVGNSF